MVGYQSKRLSGITPVIYRDISITEGGKTSSFSYYRYSDNIFFYLVILALSKLEFRLDRLFCYASLDILNWPVQICRSKIVPGCFSLVYIKGH